jgi:signal transduction histidine kinase
MAPLLVQESCLACHAKQGYKTGDIRGGLSVSQSYAPVQAATRYGIRQTTLAHGTAFLLVLAVSWGLLELLRRRWFELAGKIGELEEAHGQLLQSEKMASIGVLAAGVAHEINNPVGFVNSNLGTLKIYTEELREYDPELPRVPCLPAQINQVVMNLLTNAAHAIDERGTITVRSGHDARWAWIEVADSGHGMPPEVLKRIFDPFYTTKPVGEGTGLSLSISYGIVSKHGGHIDVSSEPGHGTTFRVCLQLLGRGPVDKATP